MLYLIYAMLNPLALICKYIITVGEFTVVLQERKDVQKVKIHLLTIVLWPKTIVQVISTLTKNPDLELLCLRIKKNMLLAIQIRNLSIFLLKIISGFQWLNFKKNHFCQLKVRSNIETREQKFPRIQEG